MTLEELNGRRIDAVNALADADARLRGLRERWEQLDYADTRLADDILEARNARAKAQQARDAATQAFDIELTRQRIEYKDEQRK